MMRRTLYIAFCLLTACGRDLTDDPIPPATFANFVINLSFPEYQKLAFDEGTKELNSIGVRGVIVYRKNSTTYLAFERNCSYHPNDACATVNVHVSGLYLTDPCCGSNFTFEGKPNGGAAWRPLRQYKTDLNGGSLTITSEVINAI